MKYCKSCGDVLHEKRAQMGYDTCVNCSTEGKWSGVPVINHKTGNEIQVVKDAEVAAEFMALSNRKGFTAFQGLNEKAYGDTSPLDVTYNPEPPTGIPSKVLSRKLDTSQYDDEKMSNVVLNILDTEGAANAKTFLEKEFQSLHISPICRKRLLLILNPFLSSLK